VSHSPYRCETALVVGAASGIGRAASLRLAKEGVRLFLADLARDCVADVAKDVRDAGGLAEAFAVDASSSSSVSDLFAALRQQAERLDLVVNSFGWLDETTFIEDLTDTQWDRMVGTNLSGVFYCCREAVRWMKEHGSGRLVNLSSVAALMPTPGALHYSASKGGVVQLTKTLAAEIARYGLRANVVAPGYVKTPMLEKMDEGFLEHIQRRTPLRRFADPEEIAGLIAFLASPEADYLVGQVLSPNGGLVI